MKHIILISVFTALYFSTYAQSLKEINTRIDSLEGTLAKLRIEKELIIKKETQALNLLKIYQHKKNKLEAPASNGDIVAKTAETGGILRDEPMGNEIMKIPANSTIYVKREHQNLYFKVTYNGKSGYLSYNSIESNREIDMVLTKKKNPSTTTTNTTNTTNPNNKKLESLSKVYGKEKAIKLVNGELWEGMSPGMVIESIGRPTNSTKEDSDWGSKEIWIYKNKELTFINGALKRWENK